MEEIETVDEILEGSILDYEPNSDHEKEPQKLPKSPIIDLQPNYEGFDAESDFEERKNTTVLSESEHDECEVVYTSSADKISNLCHAMDATKLSALNERKSNTLIKTSRQTNPPKISVEANGKQQTKPLSAQKMMYSKYSRSRENTLDLSFKRKNMETSIGPALQSAKKPFVIRPPNVYSWNRPKKSVGQLYKDPKFIYTDPFKPPTCELNEIHTIEDSDTDENMPIARNYSTKSNKISYNRKQITGIKSSYRPLKAKRPKIVVDYNTSDDATSTTSYGGFSSLNISSDSKSSGFSSLMSKKTNQITKNKKISKNEIMEKNVEAIVKNILRKEKQKRRKDISNKNSGIMSKTQRSLPVLSKNEIKFILKDFHSTSSKRRGFLLHENANDLNHKASSRREERRKVMVLNED